MPTIVVCAEHQRQGYPSTIEGTPTACDLVGALSADLAEPVPQPGGVPRTHLDCHECRWASDPAVEQDFPCPICQGEVGHRINCPRGIAFTALGSVGDPTLSIEENPIVTVPPTVIGRYKIKKDVEPVTADGLTLAHAYDKPEIESVTTAGPARPRIRGNDANQSLSEYDAPELPALKQRAKKEKNVPTNAEDWGARKGASQMGRVSQEKRRRVAKAKTTETPKPRERRRGKSIGIRRFGAIGVECYLVDGTPENFKAQTEEEAHDLRDFLNEVKTAPSKVSS